MSKEQEDLKKTAEAIGTKVKDEKGAEIQNMAESLVSKGSLPKDLLGLSDTMIEGIYGQAYRLYNTGKYKDASQLFRLLIMLNTTEAKHAMGLAACYHMMKEYVLASEIYSLCSMIDPNNPIPYFHSSDCYLQMNDIPSAIISLEMAIDRSRGYQQFNTLRDRAKMTVEGLKKQLGIAQEEKKADQSNVTKK